MQNVYQTLTEIIHVRFDGIYFSQVNMTAKVPHTAGNYILKLPDVYTNISEITGITKLTDKPAAGSMSLGVRAAVAAGIIRRAHIRLSNKKIKTIYFVAANAPQYTAVETLEYTAGITITSCYFPTHVKFG